MPRLLLTAFEPFAGWTTNASQLCCDAVLAGLPRDWDVEVRTYPVDFDRVLAQVPRDLARGYDVALHLGQTQSSARLRLEACAINIGEGREPAVEGRTLIPGAPAGYFCDAPLGDWARTLVAAGVPTLVSYHAGTFLCNALLYASCHAATTRSLPTRSLFFHVPLDPSQLLEKPGEWPTLPATTCARGVRLILDELAGTTLA